ncbi:hypothetical protein pb186bvf_019490 [Paramecium bursaria]
MVLPKLSMIVGISALSFQAFILYPWHDEIKLRQSQKAITCFFRGQDTQMILYIVENVYFFHFIQFEYIDHLHKPLKYSKGQYSFKLQISSKKADVQTFINRKSINKIFQNLLQQKYQN